MAGGAANASSRGRGKFRKFTRGGGKHFSRNLRPLDADGNEISMWSQDAQRRTIGSDAEEEEDDENNSSEEDEDLAAAGSSKQQEMSREERKKEKKAKKLAAIAKTKSGSDSDDDEDDSADDVIAISANPNHTKAARDQTKAFSVDEVTRAVKAVNISSTPNKKEREAQAARERYQKLHDAGKTEQAMVDMARLAEVRRRREAEAARRLVEQEEREAREAEKRSEVETKEAKKRELAMGPAAKGKGRKGKK